MYQLRLKTEKNRIVSSLIQEFDNPIIGEIKDTGEIAKTFNRYPFVPYAGTGLYSSHSYLNLLLDIVDNCPTLSQCIEVIGNFCFNSGQTLYKNSGNLFLTEDMVEADLATQQRFTEHLMEINFIHYNQEVNFVHFVKALYFEIKNGNCYVELIRDKVGEQVSYTYKIHPQTHCLYTVHTNNTFSIAVSKSFDYNYLRKYPPKLVPIYPEVSADDEDMVNTMFHFKTRTNGLYGRPDWISCLLSAYNEYQNVLYRVKLAGRDFSPKVLIEVEGDDPSLIVDNEDDEDVLNRIIDNFTVGGKNATSILAMERPHGATPVHVHEFKVNTQEDFYDKISEINEREIIKANGWSRLLLTGEVLTGFNTTPYDQELRNREVSVLRKYQTLVSSMVHRLLKPYFDDQDPEMNNYQMYFNLPYDDNIDDSEGGDREQPGEGNVS